MKRSEELFMIINDIDDDIIDEAKIKADTPVQMKPEPRSPIKGIIALAACIAVLAVGVFAIVRFKLGSGIEPAPVDDSSSYLSDSTASEYSSSDTDSLDDSSDSGSGIDPSLTEEDLELQAILSGILDKARELDGMFGGMSANGKEYEFKICNSYLVEDHPAYMQTRTYYLVSEGQRTEPNGLFAVPQSRAEMEGLLLQYFSKRAVKTYMDNIISADIAEEPDGTYTVETENGYPAPLIEADGKLYYCNDILMSDLDFDPQTARLISKTNSTVKFNYYNNEYFAREDGALVFEGGSWKLNHFNYDGFISEYPTEFTAEDEELQEILDRLSPNDAITDWFHAAGDTFYGQHFVFEGLENAENYHTIYRKLPTGKFDGGKEYYPRSYEELTELLPKYFTQQTIDWYIPQTNKGTVTGISDTGYHIKTEKPVTGVETIPAVIEVDGEMYYMISDKSGNGIRLWDSAKVTSRTDNSIEFTHLHTLTGGYSEEKGLIEFERGDWRLSYYKVWFGSNN